MSLRHALLAVLTAEPMTGYNLLRYFDGTVAYMWQAPHSQIYPELRRMEQDELVEVQVVPRGKRAEKRVYSLTATGLAELRSWLGEPAPYAPERDPSRVRAAHFEFSSYAAARDQLRAHHAHYTTALVAWERMVDDLEAHRVPLLRSRLRQRPEAEHEAIVAFKLFAFRGEAAKARTEIAWAAEGLALLDHLEQHAVPLWGETPDETGQAEATPEPPESGG
ncbi:PadR family transcriptional regulator [Streptomyces sp. 184]|uniref:PadR family transcriptional regulator n=1 Tax=Streptomyces sp. 184 TaxID=1827526 RepID=UPI0038915DC1